MIEPRLLTDKQAADYCSLPVRTIVKLGIGMVRVGDRVRFDRFALDRYLNELSGVEAPTPAHTLPPPTHDDDPEAALARFVRTRSHAPSRRS